MKSREIIIARFLINAVPKKKAGNYLIFRIPGSFKFAIHKLLFEHVKKNKKNIAIIVRLINQNKRLITF
tara:strand:+ start:648 stop:854 length:207 start_codon:yes stop_codon:yes gene_type:complete